MADIVVYTKDWCPYCAKAKSLLKAKGLSWDEVDVTSDHALQEEMIERSGRRTVPQVFIHGTSIGGYDDLALLNSTGELDVMLGIEGASAPMKAYDVVVVGGGPAGLSAAIYAARKSLQTALVATDIGGQLGTTAEVANYPGFQLVTGPDLVQRFAEHAEGYGIDRFVGERVTEIGFKDRCKVVHTASGRKIPTRALIVATGAHKRRLNVPGEDRLAGKGVVYCSTCDGPLFRDLRIAIVGAGNSGLEAAIEMSGIARSVHLVSSRGLTGDDILQGKVRSAGGVQVLPGHRPVEIHGDERVEGLTVADVETGAQERLDVDGVFIEVGLYPNSEFVVDLLDCNERGEIRVDAKGATGVQGIYAAGDVTAGRPKQVVVAAGDGANAALSAFEYLISQP